MPNQWTKAKETGIPYIIKDSTREKFANHTKNRVWDEQARKRHSDSMKRAVAKNPESYSSGNRGRVKRIEYDGIILQGKWELYFYQWCKRNNIAVQKCNEWFEYNWNGVRKYFPDFYLPDHDMYVEVKGYKTERDEAKWSQFKKSLLVVDKRDIPLLLNDTYTMGR